MIPSDRAATRRRYLHRMGAVLAAAGVAGCSEADEEPSTDDDSPGGGSVDEAQDGESGEDSTDGDADQDDGSDESEEQDEDGVEDSEDDEAEEETEKESDGPARSDADELLPISETTDANDPLFSAHERFEGSGQAVTDEFSLFQGFLTMVYEHEGTENFIVELSSDSGTEAVLANQIGAATGARATMIGRGDYVLDVQADGDWTVWIGQPVSPDGEIRTLPQTASGEGNSVVGPVELESATTVVGQHEGEDNYIVEAYDETAIGSSPAAVVFNEVGQFEGETRMDATGIIWMAVQADGPWRLEIES